LTPVTVWDEMKAENGLGNVPKRGKEEMQRKISSKIGQGLEGLVADDVECLVIMRREVRE